MTDPTTPVLCARCGRRVPLRGDAEHTIALVPDANVPDCYGIKIECRVVLDIH